MAERVGELHGCSVYQITDSLVGEKPASFLKCGAMSSSEKITEATYEPPSVEDTIVLVFPLWAGKFPPAIRAFLQVVSKEKIIAVPTSLGTKLKDRNGFIAVVDLVGKEIEVPDLSGFIAENK